MTREEAIARIKDHIEIHRYHERNAVKIFEAFEMAIKALEQPEIIYCSECKHMMPDGKCRQFADSTIRPSASDFCSAGERKTDD